MSCSMALKTELGKRIYASLLAGAVGDAMGFPVEGHHYKAIRKKFGKIDRPIVRLGPELTPNVTSTEYTDDTVMRHMVCKAIIDSKGHPTPYTVFEVWRDTIKDFEHWHWWLNTRIVAAKAKWGYWLDVREIGSDSVPCNDAAMIIAPVGLINPGDPEKAALQALDMACVWQNGYSRECAAAMAAAHAEALHPDATPSNVIETAKFHSPKLAPFIDRAVKLVEQTQSIHKFTEQYYEKYVPGPNEHYWRIGCENGDPDDPWCFNADPLEVCSLGFAFFLLGKGNLAEAISGGASFGRDCDTIAGIAGSLSGALYGGDTLPKRWCQSVIEACPEPDIFELATALTRIAIKNLEECQQRISDVMKLTE